MDTKCAFLQWDVWLLS